MLIHRNFMDQGQAYRTLKEDNISMLSKVNDSSVYRVHAEGYRYKKLWTDQPFEYDQRILQYHSKNV